MFLKFILASAFSIFAMFTVLNTLRGRAAIVFGAIVFAVILTASPEVKASTIGLPTVQLDSPIDSMYGKILAEQEKANNPLRLKDKYQDSKIHKAIAKAAKVTGNDPNFLATIANVESTMNPKASNGKVKGLMQFTPGTWRLMVKRHAKKHGIKKPNIHDPYHSAVFAGELLNDNREWLEAKLKRKVTDREVYLAYFIAPQYAVRILKSNKNRAAASLVPSSFASGGNKSFFYKNGKPLTVRQFLGLVTAKLDKRYLEITHPEIFNPVKIAQCDKPVHKPAPMTLHANTSMRNAASVDGIWWDRRLNDIITV